MQLAAASLQLISEPLLQEKNIKLYLKREDLLHPHVSGNKWRKLKYNLQAAQDQRKTTLLTFGGAYSNHIAAVAAAGRAYHFQTVGFIRGERHELLNPTLTFAQSCGMQLYYLDRATYRRRQEPAFRQQLQTEYPQAYILPEGGTNALAVKGCAEIITDIAVPFDYICGAVGTGGTLAGLIAGLRGQSQVIGFPALKGGNFLAADVIALLQQAAQPAYANWQLQTNYHFGGYAKITPALIAFIQAFKAKHDVLLEPVYTGKMLYGLYDLIRQDFSAAGSTIIAIHTGGLQGWAGFTERFGLTL